MSTRKTLYVDSSRPLQENVKQIREVLPILCSMSTKIPKSKGPFPKMLEKSLGHALFAYIILHCKQPHAKARVSKTDEGI